ncbi:ARM repeat superfamily protein [Euphorbia peplus]|nr:ARM repeat superfamily protein [Euphorbia peplus]
MDAVSDILPAFAKSTGVHFAPIFAKLFEPLTEFARSSRPPQDRAMVVVCLAEVAQDMGAPMADYVDRLMRIVLRELTSAGHCSFLPLIPDIIVIFKFYGLFGESEPDNAVRDDAAGAVARMIMVHPQSIPLNQSWSMCLLKETQEVKAQVGRAFSDLISLYAHQMQPLLGNLSPAHANALAAYAPKS